MVPKFVSIDVCTNFLVVVVVKVPNGILQKSPPTWCATPNVFGFPQNWIKIVLWLVLFNAKKFVICSEKYHTFLSQRHGIIFLVYVEGTLPLIRNVGPPMLRSSTSNWRPSPTQNIVQNKSKSKSAIHYPGRKFKAHCKLWPKAILDAHKAYQWYTPQPTWIH